MKLFTTLILSAFTLLWSCSNETNNTKESTPTFKTGSYSHASFQSKQRGKVAFNVYLPPNWSKENAKEYPLMTMQ